MRPQSAGRARASASAVGAVGAHAAVGGPLGSLGPLPAASSKARMGRVGDERVEMGAGAGVVGADVGVVVRVLVQVLSVLALLVQTYKYCQYRRECGVLTRC